MITLATSIAPLNVDNQYNALKSWDNAGFKIISCNTQKEINQLSNNFPFIEFIPVDNYYSPALNKAYIYLNDVLSVLENTSTEICGIVNSDIYLVCDKDILSKISADTTATLFCGQRKDVISLDDTLGKIYAYGFDAFIFKRSLIKKLPQCPFCLGKTAWDYWLPIEALKNGYMLKTMSFLELLHIKHELNYDYTDKITFFYELIKYVDENLYNKLKMLLNTAEPEQKALMAIFFPSMIAALQCHLNSFLNKEIKSPNEFISQLRTSPHYRLALSYISNSFLIEDKETFENTFYKLLEAIKYDIHCKKHFLDAGFILAGFGKTKCAENIFSFYLQYIEDNANVEKLINI